MDFYKYQNFFQFKLNLYNLQLNDKLVFINFCKKKLVFVVKSNININIKTFFTLRKILIKLNLLNLRLNGIKYFKFL